MKKMKKLNVIKKLVNYGVITLVGFNLFTGCVKLEPNYLPEYTIQFQIGLPLDSNGNYHLSLDRTRWQTLHRVSGVITDNYDNFVEFFGVEWDSDLYWYLGDTLGYIVTQYLSSEAQYVSVDTSYMIGLNGLEVPTSNSYSYSNSYGQVSNMIAPVQSMIGDTLRLRAGWYGGSKTFNIVLD